MTSLLAALLEDHTWPPAPAHGVEITTQAPGIWQMLPADRADGPALLLSAGVHGDETAAVELLSQLADQWRSGEATLRRPVLLVFGNLPAMRAGRRYLDADLNRQFSEELMPASPAEATRASVLREVVQDFSDAFGPLLHLDLHSAIRASRYKSFAIHPQREGGSPDLPLLAAAGIEAVLVAGTRAPTFSAWTTRRLSASAYTFEMGQVRRFGEGQADEFACVEQTLRALAAAEPLPVARTQPLRYRVTREIRKGTDEFRFDLAEAPQNFTALAAGSLIAHDGPDEWYAATGEHLVFPNPDVRPGLRAALLVVPVEH